MKAAAVRVVQRALVAEGFNPGQIDGKTGSKTYGAVGQALQGRLADLPDDWPLWSGHRKTVAYLQLLCRDRGIDVGAIDGYWGPQTEYAFDTLAYLLENEVLPPPWRDETPLDVNPNGWPRQDEVSLIGFYGHMGTNLVKLELPYPHRLSWNLRKNVSSFYCHAKVHDSAKRVLQGVLDHYGMDRIRELRLDRWGGCYNKRRMRGGTRWSMHSPGASPSTTIRIATSSTGVATGPPSPSLSTTPGGVFGKKKAGPVSDAQGTSTGCICRRRNCEGGKAEYPQLH